MHQLVVKKFSTLFDARCNHEVYVIVGLFMFVTAALVIPVQLPVHVEKAI